MWWIFCLMVILVGAAAVPGDAQDFVSVESCGAAGDNIHDDGPAIERCLDTHPRVLLGDKTYFINTPITITKTVQLQGLPWNDLHPAQPGTIQAGTFLRNGTNLFTGSIKHNMLTVSDITQGAVTLGQILSGPSLGSVTILKAGPLPATYEVSAAPDIASEPMASRSSAVMIRGAGGRGTRLADIGFLQDQPAPPTPTLTIGNANHGNGSVVLPVPSGTAWSAAEITPVGRYRLVAQDGLVFSVTGPHGDMPPLMVGTRYNPPGAAFTAPLSVDWAERSALVPFQKGDLFMIDIPQQAWQPDIYPPSISVNSTSGMVSLNNILCGGVYSCVSSFASGRLNIDGLFGQDFQSLLSIAYSYDVDHVRMVHGFPYWSSDINVLTYTQAKANMLSIGRQDTAVYSDIFGIAHHSCMHIVDSPPAAVWLPGGTVTKAVIQDLKCDGSNYALWISGTAVTLQIGALQEQAQSWASTLAMMGGAATRAATLPNSAAIFIDPLGKAGALLQIGSMDCDDTTFAIYLSNPLGGTLLQAASLIARRYAGSPPYNNAIQQNFASTTTPDTIRIAMAPFLVPDTGQPARGINPGTNTSYVAGP